MTVINADIPCKIFKTRVENHHKLKSSILNAIADFGTHSIIHKGQRISNTDWHIRHGVGHELDTKRYAQIVQPALNAHNQEIANYTGVRRVFCDGVWFQQYKKHDFHSWHVHGNCLYSNVYYVDFGKNCPKTLFRFMGQEFSVDVEEGEILTFPSFLQHCSTPNQSEYTKTVIAFNSNIEGVINE